jgi:hypothetical protein
MDPIVAVDTIYQSMFRVLTPYPGKKTGFFVDLLRDRLIRFLYEYDDRINRNNKHQQPEDRMKRLRNLIFTYDLNGIILKQDNVDDYIKQYTDLINVLGLDSVASYNRTIGDYKIENETDISRVNKLFGDEDINKLYKQFGLTSKADIKSKIEEILLLRGKIKKPDGDGTSIPMGPSKKNTTKKELTIEKKREAVIDYFSNMIALFILFEDDDIENCDMKYVTDELHKIESMREITSSEYNSICSDETKMKTLRCYMKTDIDYYQQENDFKKEIKDHSLSDAEITEILKDIFNNKILEFKRMVKKIIQQDPVVLINIYCNIKSGFMKIKEFNVDNLSQSVCSESFIKDEKILKTIRERLVVRKDQKDQDGEVFTPIKIVCDMLNNLPEEVWENETLTWLDPANGIGNFPIIVYYRLMQGLKSKIPDDKRRSKHIIEKMIFMIEKNTINANVCKKIFKMIDPRSTPNIHRGVFFVENDDSSKKKKTTHKGKPGSIGTKKIKLRIIDDDWERQFGFYRFDIIMGNPPYNKDGVGKGGGVYWPRFVNKSFDVLKPNGYLTFIHPLGWRKPFKEGDQLNNSGKIFYDFKRLGHLHYIFISDEKIPSFPKVDYYVFQKKVKPNPITHIVNKYKSTEQHSHINVSNLEFIPNLITDTCSSILNKLMVDKGQKFNIIRDQRFNPTKETLFSKGISHAYYFNPDSSEYIVAYKTLDKIPDYFNENKVILTYKAGKKQGHLYAKYYSTEIGGSNNTMYQIVKDKKQGIQLENYFNSKLITFLIKITQYGEPPFYINEFKILNMISIPMGLKDNPTDEDIYDYYGITKEEKELIESIVSGDILRVDGSDTPPIKPKRCQKGSRKNKKTGLCETVSPVKGKGVKKNRTTRRKIT